MPLLKRKAFEKSTASEWLRDDDEVFHCEITDEIFKDYEEYCERIILVNSMVWSCEMTGKNHLTYAEALESEKAARRSLKDFPMELRIPILYIASRTKWASFAELSETVFNFVRERFFVGESVEACLDVDLWQEAHVLSVLMQAQTAESSSSAIPPASAFTYEVEQFADEDSQGQIGTVAHDRVRRRKGIFSRDKCRLFLKQFVEMSAGSIYIKQSALEKYNINRVVFNQIFTGNPPEFANKKPKVGISPATKNQTKASPASKPGSAAKKKPSPDKKGKQQSMDKFVKKTDKTEASAKPKSNEKTEQARKDAQELADKMRRAEEQMRIKKEEEKARKKEKHARLQAYLKEWQKTKDDLDLEDHKPIPKGTPIDIEGIPHKHFGDFLAVLEFVHLYSETLKAKDVFHSGLDLETFRKGLTTKEHSWILCDLVQMMLTTIFSLQEDEAEEYNEDGRIAESTDEVEDTEIGALGVNKAVELATKASKWSQTYLGTPLSKLHIDPTTLTEVLRLHLLSSGAMGGSRCAAWRYQQRGGWRGADDAGLALRCHRPHALRPLATNHLAMLSLDDKFAILNCLMAQILSYATVRDIIEERLEAYKNLKQEMRMLQIQERKREIELVTVKSKLRKEALAKKEELKLSGDAAKTLDKEVSDQLEKLEKEADTKKAQYQKKVLQMHSDCFEHLSYLGSDRAYRRYWINQACGGIFVETGNESRGQCLDKPVIPAPRDGDTLAYVTKLFDTLPEKGGSDKENDSAANSRNNSPKKPLASVNGLAQKLNGLESSVQLMRDLMMCTGDSATCLVHDTGESRPRWEVYHTEEQLDALVQSLNKRGFRENELKQALENDKQAIVEHMKKCQLYYLNSIVGPPPPVTSARLRKVQASMTVPEDCTISEAVELSLRDYILELEEKLFHGCLGSLSVNDREAWRGTIMLRGYDKQVDYLTWGPGKQYRDDYHLPNGVIKQPPDTDPPITIAELKYRDPGSYLSSTPLVPGVKSEPMEEASGKHLLTVRELASALLQLEQGTTPKYIKRPLGLDDKERKEREAKGKPLELDALERWEVSLMQSTSFAQVLLHLFTLDSSICWSASILNANCRICRRKTDPDNMLLCDNCNKGHHMYCLKPKLTKVPQGDWFCDACKPKEVRTPRKKRKLFSDDDIEDSIIEDEDDDSNAIDIGVCGTCGSGGRLAAKCTQCRATFHEECVQNYHRRWQCHACTHPQRDTEDSDDNAVLVTLKKRKSRKSSKEPSPMVNGHAEKRSRKSKDEHNTSKKSRSSRANTPLTNGVHEETKPKKRSSRHEPALHLESWQEVLKDVMRHKDCWPFYEPVVLEDVPDYLDIIDIPMDFTTIKDKLNAGSYKSDADVISDITLIFVNCYTYNQDTHLVCKAGVRLEKYINKRCSEFNLPTLPEIDLSAETSEPKSKRQKHK